jgi:flavin reductase (DIM6/NTAB) family NADH-FMN oxidoreductase RutF
MESYIPVEGPRCLVPAPVVVVGTYKDDGEPNFSVAGAAATVCSNPPLLSVSFREATLTFSLLSKRKEFTVNIVGASRIAEVDYVGTRTGASEDKAASVGWPTAKASKVNAPYSPAFGLVYQCRLVDSINLGSHTVFFGQIIEVNIRDDCVGEGGAPVLSKIDPVIFSLAEVAYYKVLPEKFAPAFDVYKTLKK